MIYREQPIQLNVERMRLPATYTADAAITTTSQARSNSLSVNITISNYNDRSDDHARGSIAGRVGL